MNWYIFDTVDLEAEQPKGGKLYQQLMLPGDNNGHVWRVSVFAGKEPVNISGQAVQAFFTRADGTTVVVTGIAHGNVASVSMPRDVYLVRGALRAIMRLGDSVSSTSDPVITLAERRFYISDGVGDTLVSPSDEFPTVQGLSDAFDVLSGSVDNLSDELTALEAKVTGSGWKPLSTALGISEGLSNMGYHTGSPVSYRVENGHHVIVHANVAFTYTAGAVKQITSVALPPELIPESRVVRFGVVSGSQYIGRFYLAGKNSGSDGLVFLERAYNLADGSEIQPSASITWSDAYIDWFVDAQA